MRSANRLISMIGLSIAALLMSLAHFHSLEVRSEIWKEHMQKEAHMNIPLLTSSREDTNVTVALTTMDAQPTLDSVNCFKLNSPSWMDDAADRLGNLDDVRMDDNFISATILSVDSPFTSVQGTGQMAGNLLKQTLCQKNSTFLTLDNTLEEWQDSPPSNATIHAWSVKLLYLATHIHQHWPALEEAKLRNSNQQCRAEWAAPTVGKFDYECPQAKFLVVSMGRLGLGAVMRLGVVNALIAGIASNHTVLVVNNAPVGPRFLREPWLLASCPRRDMQCFYMPMTPCVLTRQEIANATTLDRGQARALFRTGQLPAHLTDERVVLMDLVLRPQRTPRAFRENTVRILQDYILRPLQQQQESLGKPHPLLPLLTQATNFILEEEELENGSYYYFGHNSKHNHALVYYAMRPNLEYAERLNEIMLESIPPDMDPDHTIGVPIRDSDKCDMESECMPFDQYMNMTRHTWTKYYRNAEQHASPSQFHNHAAGATTNIIVTSEAAHIHMAMERYQTEGRHHRELPFAARFVSNHFDVHQGTGNPARTITNTTTTNSMDEVMLSAVSSLQAQLWARYTMGNCCSNFHVLLFDFLRDGCGAAKDPVAQCMQDHEDPSFRLCCHWSKTQECIVKRQGSSDKLVGKDDRL